MELDRHDERDEHSYAERNKVPFFRPIRVVLAPALFVWMGAKPRPNDVLIIQDEMPHIDVLALFLDEHGDRSIQVVDQDGLPADLSRYEPVLLFVHQDLEEATEKAVIDYTRSGGRSSASSYTQATA